MRRFFSIGFFIVFGYSDLTAQSAAGAAGAGHGPFRFRNGVWHAILQRNDRNAIPFNFELKDSAGKKVLYIWNAGERLLVDDIRMEGDSVIIRLPFFESQIRATMTGLARLEGVWLKRLKDTYQSMSFVAYYNDGFRFLTSKDPVADVSGRWAADFGDPAVKKPARLVGEFEQKGSRVTGTFLDPTGDYRYLEGVVDGDSLKLSCFDGGHAYAFSARIVDDHELRGGQFFSGPQPSEPWTAVRDSTAKLPDEFSLTKWRKDAGTMDFSFPDIDGKTVSFSDARFLNKVVLVQIMGSWCPNCMDETRFLSDFYNQYHSKGVEIVGLAYERSADFARSQNSLRAFQRRFGVKYPLLITGVTVDDPDKTEKTLPQLDQIVGFPTTIFVDRQGRIAKIHTGFNGPGTGAHYVEQKKEFYAIVDELLGE